MHTVRVYRVDAFTDEPLTGHPAGVVPDADELSGEQLAAIARELAPAETAFLSASPDADYRVRYASPDGAADRCAHATVAAVARLHETGALDAGTVTIETNAGVLAVDIEEDGTVWLPQDVPEIREVDLGYGRVADALGVDRSALEGASEDLPLAVASTGVPALLVPITYLSDVGGADPDPRALESLAADVEAAGVYLFTFDALEADSALHARFFAPDAGLSEDSVTGAAGGAVGAYLERYDAFDPIPEEVRIEQGHYVDRPGFVRVRVDGTVRVGGRAVTALEGSIVVPEEADDGIIEA